jgi:hypothetical protein
MAHPGVDLSADGGLRLTCDGISDLVRGQSSPFLTELEDCIEVLDLAKTQLVPDTSSIDNSARLYLASWRFARVEIDLWIKSQPTMPLDQSDE